jgi:meso-butanediol dehydrogenase / (S,S)-butanediol dehydrogenase / diacetyl reductase
MQMIAFKDRFAGKVAVVTGAASGIGLAITKRLLAEGAKVVGSDLNPVPDLGDAFVGIEGDVTKESSAEGLVAAAVDRFGGVHAAFNVAGGARGGYIVDLAEADWDFTVDLCLKGVFLGMKHQARQMMRQGSGAIVNIASISGLRASTMRVAYGTSKAAVAHLTKQQAVELSQYGIRVNAVAPGPVDTAMAKEVHTPEIRADYHDHIPLNRYGLETELANAICFLCGDQAGYISGQVLAVDGGFDAAGVGLPTMRGERRNL